MDSAKLLIYVSSTITALKRCKCLLTIAIARSLRQEYNLGNSIAAWRSSNLFWTSIPPQRHFFRIRVVSCHTMPLLSDSEQRNMYCRVCTT
jgi:hypothetical protein